MDLKTLMNTNPKTLAELQHKELKKHVLNRLKTIQGLIEQEKYAEVENFLNFSPAGDGYGCDNHFINFGYDDEDESRDIDEVLDSLLSLKGIK